MKQQSKFDKKRTKQENKRPSSGSKIKIEKSDHSQSKPKGKGGSL